MFRWGSKKGPNLDEKGKLMSEELDSWDGRLEGSQFEEYSKKYKDYMIMTRRNGILEVRLHTDGGPAVHDWIAHGAWGEAWVDIGRDPENEVLIITGTGDKWQVGNPEVWKTAFRDWSKDSQIKMYHEAFRLIENLVFAIDIPTIGAINGPGTHCEIATLCDITLCTEDADFFDPHFLGGTPPGDGMALTLQQTIGFKRTAHYVYTGTRISGRHAVELGIANECLSRKDLLPRAWEIAEMMMERSKSTRRLSHAILSRPWKQALVNDMGFHLTHQMFDMAMDREHPMERIRKFAHRLGRQ